MRVEKRESVSKFSQLSCPGQTRTRVARGLTSESLYEIFLGLSNERKGSMRVDES